MGRPGRLAHERSRAKGDGQRYRPCGYGKRESGGFGDDGDGMGAENRWGGGDSPL